MTNQTAQLPITTEHGEHLDAYTPPHVFSAVLTAGGEDFCLTPAAARDLAARLNRAAAKAEADWAQAQRDMTEIERKDPPMTQTPATELAAPYACRDCGHPRYALVPLSRMTAAQRKCTECEGALTTTHERPVTDHA